MSQMDERIIVDTSIWIEYFKNNKNVGKIVDDGLRKGIIYILGPIISELLQGVKTQKEYNKLSECIDAIPYFECEFKDWVKAGHISFSLKKKGLTVPLTDIVISAVSINRKAKIFTLDKHFALIPETELFVQR